MKLALATVFLAVILIGAQAAPTTFDFGSMKGMVEAMSVVNGEKIPADPKAITKVEEMLKGLIHKHLEKKKLAKKAARKEVAKPVISSKPEPIAQEVVKPEIIAQPQIPARINWEEHAESRNLINQKIPGGTESIDALIKLIQEQKAQK